MSNPILDSGDRTAFESGAVRDCKAGNGRCDLMPLDMVARVLEDDSGIPDRFLFCLADYRISGDIFDLIRAAEYLSRGFYSDPLDSSEDSELHSMARAMLDLSHHFRDGAEKYGERNWEKGIPVHSYIDSAARHYMKLLAGMTDEPHHRAAIWNVLCAAWTAEHHPELNDYVQRKEEEE